MGVHVMLSQRGGTNGLAFIVNGDDGNRDAIRIHAGSDVVKPGVDRPARIEMSPLAEVPLCDYGREVGTVSEWDGRHAYRPVRLTISSAAGAARVSMAHEQPTCGARSAAAHGSAARRPTRTGW